MYMLAPRWNTPAQMGKLGGVIYFAFRSAKFPACLYMSMLDKYVAEVWDKELCTAPVYRVKSRKLALNPCGLAWPDLKLTWPSWNSGCRCYQLSEVSHWQLIICALHGGRCWGWGQRFDQNYSRREPGCLYVTACFKYLLQSRFLQLSLL